MWILVRGGSGGSRVGPVVVDRGTGDEIRRSTGGV